MRHRPDEAASLSLELALTLPAFFLVVIAFLQTVGFARDLVVVQVAAREGARAAAVSRTDGPVHDAVAVAVDGRPARISIAPGARSAGDLVRVEVTLDTALTVGPRTVTGASVARVEAVVVAP